MYEAQLPKDWKFIISDASAKLLVVANDEIFGKTKGFVDEIDSLEAVINLQGDGESSWKALLPSAHTPDRSYSHRDLAP